MDYKRLDFALKENGLSRRRFAQSVGINPTTLQALFNSKSGIKDRAFVIKAADLLHVDPIWLAGYGERIEADEQDNTTEMPTVTISEREFGKLVFRSMAIDAIKVALVMFADDYAEAIQMIRKAIENVQVEDSEQGEWGMRNEG